MGGDGRRVEVGDAAAGADLGEPVDEVPVVGVAAVDDAESGGRGDGRDLAELLDAAGDQDGRVVAGELLQGDVAVGGLEGQPGQDGAQEFVVVAGERLDGEVVGVDEAVEEGGVAGGEAGEPVADALAEGVADGGQGAVLVQRLAGGGGAQAGGVDDAADEEGPVGRSSGALSVRSIPLRWTRCPARWAGLTAVGRT